LDLSIKVLYTPTEYNKFINSQREGNFHTKRDLQQ
jgi:hypothetical protein